MNEKSCNFFKTDQQKSANLLEGKGGFISVLIPEVIIHPKICLPAELVSGLAVWDALNHATLRNRNIS